MKLRGRTWMFLCCALPPLVQACGPADDSGALGDRPPELAPIGAEPPPSTSAEGLVTHMLVGELRSVDPERGTLLVRTSDGVFEVAYTGDTDVVVGGRTQQGLAPAPGARVTVHYRAGSAGDGWTAIRVETHDGTDTGPTAH